MWYLTSVTTSWVTFEFGCQSVKSRCPKQCFLGIPRHALGCVAAQGTPGHVSSLRHVHSQQVSCVQETYSLDRIFLCTGPSEVLTSIFVFLVVFGLPILLGAHGENNVAPDLGSHLLGDPRFQVSGGFNLVKSGCPKMIFGTPRHALGCAPAPATPGYVSCLTHNKFRVQRSPDD